MMSTQITTTLLRLLIVLACKTASSLSLQQENHRHRVHLIGSYAPLFSGGSLSDCQTANDTSCEGGIAAVAAMQRYHANDGAPVVFMPRLDKSSQFVQIHELGWSVNRLVLREYFNFTFMSMSPSLLLQHKEDFTVSQRDISDLQTHDFPLLLTNADIPPSVSWHPYVERVHYDTTTNLAILSLAGNGEPMSSEDQIAAVRSALNEVARENELRGCTPSTSLFDQYQQDYGPVVDTTTNNNHDRRTTTSVVDLTWNDTTLILPPEQEQASTHTNCWIPVLFFTDTEPDAFAELVKAMVLLEHPPAVIVDSGNNDVNGTYQVPVQLETPNLRSLPNSASSLWVTSTSYSSGGYYQHTFTFTEDGSWVANVADLILDLEDDLTEDMKDAQYGRDIAFLRTLADQAEANDPIVGKSTEMPVARDGDYRRCKGGECEQGNLFADALRWRANADVAFVTSGGLRGSGWPAGNVTVSNIWSTLPFPNTMCTGVMSGVSLFKLVDYSMSAATFQSGETQDGGRLLQVSGMKIVYNTQLEEHRVISIDIWDDDFQAYLPIERLKFYKFSTDSYLCGAYDPYPTLVGEGLTIEGETPGSIGEDLHQNIVGEYLSEFGDVYVASREGRLTNDTSATEALNLVQTEEGCPPHTYWLTSKLSCVNCPNASHVQFSDAQLEFQAESGVDEWYNGRILLVNREQEAFQVVPKTVPNWFSFVFRNTTEDGPNLHVDGRPTLLMPGDSLAVDFAVNAEHLEAGTALGTVSFGVLDGGDFPGCVDNGDATFDVLLRVTPSPEWNQLGKIRYVGFSLMGVALAMAAGFAVWTNLYKRVRVVQKMQPLFLIMICVGVGVMSLAMGSLSLDDEIVSLQWCNFACMSLPWFLSMGWTMTFAAIYSKLWRINKLFGNAHFRRITVSERDALSVFTVLFGLNFIILLLWTVLDPMEWVRRTVTGETWNTYGMCSSGTTGDSLMGLAIGVNTFALLLAAVEAYKARNISGEFSETKQLVLAVYTFVQVIAVVMPVLFLIDSEDVTARYFLQVGVIFCLSISMLLNIFIPMVLHLRRAAKSRADGNNGCNVVVSGLNTQPTMNASSTQFTNSVRRGSAMPQDISSSYFDASRTSHGCGGLESLQEEMNEHYDAAISSSTPPQEDPLACKVDPIDSQETLSDEV